jgi:hypothetical protein
MDASPFAKSQRMRREIVCSLVEYVFPLLLINEFKNANKKLDVGIFCYLTPTHLLLLLLLFITICRHKSHENVWKIGRLRM